MPKKLTQLTVSGIKYAGMQTMYSDYKISFYSWLEKERDRILACPGRRAVIRKMGKTKKGQTYALWVDDIAGVDDINYYRHKMDQP